MEQVVKKKRGRKSKKELALLKKLEAQNKKLEEKKVPKKRGRKPKGGKIVNKKTSKIEDFAVKENIILHLKCNSDDIHVESSLLTPFTYQPNISSVQPYNNDETNDNLLSNEYSVIVDSAHVVNNDQSQSVKKSKDYNTQQCKEKQCSQENNDSVNNELIWNKLKNLKMKLHNNKICDKKSACFWCSYDFVNPPIYIPRTIINETYEVYGCFCTPECATAYLFDEPIDNTTRWERYSLLNSIYSSIFKYTKNIKPAPKPHYLLDKFYGTLSIDEYRTLLRNDKLLMIVDKPLTRILPEICEDNNEFNINNSSLSTPSKNTYKLSRSKAKVKKHDVNFFNM